MRPLVWLLSATMFLLQSPPAATQAPPADALLKAALERARSEQKALFVHFGASWCAPCKKLEAFLHAPETSRILEAHFVLLRLVVWENKDKTLNNPGADDLMFKWGGRQGIPFYVFLDSAGRKLVETAGAADYPASSARVEAFAKLLEKAVPRMTREERTVLVDYLTARSDGLGSIQGRITGAAGQPVGSTRVSLVLRAYVEGQWQPAAGPTTDSHDSGYFEFSRLAAGDYQVMVGTTGKMVSVAPGQDLSGVDVVVPSDRPVRVSGSVLAPSGAPLARASLTLTAKGFPLVRHAATAGADGTFAVTGVGPGEYVLWARGSGTRTTEPAAVGSGTVVVSGTDVAGISIATTNGAALAGRLVIQGSALAAADRAALRVTAVAAPLAVGAPRGNPESAIGDDGRFRIQGLFGPRAIRVSGLPPGWMLKSVTVGGRDVTDALIDLRPEARPGEVEIVIADRGGVIGGRVADASGAAVTRGAVVVFSADAARWAYPSRFVKIAPVGADGAYAVQGLPAGRYLVAPVTVMAPAWDAPESLEALRARAIAVALDEGERKAVDLVHPRGR